MRNSFWKDYGLMILLAVAAVVAAVLVFGRSVRSELPSDGAPSAGTQPIETVTGNTGERMSQ